MTFGVYFRGAPLGTLTSEGTRLSFTYHPDAVQAGGPTLSVRLPVRAEPYDHDATHAYFANLLPEDEYKVLLARVLGLSDRNVAGLLGAVGGECAGAVSIWPVGQAPPFHPEYLPLSDDDIERLYNAADAAERMGVVSQNRLSLAGGMEKLGLRRKDGRWHRGRAGAPTTHIVKWPQSRFPDQSYNELFCMKLWGAAGLPVPEVHVEGGKTAVLVVERYDRLVADDGNVALVHQEDFCQALGYDPAHKYQGEGEEGPGLADCARVIREHCAVPAREMALLLRWALANFLVGNGDGHGKNLSLLHTRAEGIRLAPFYDVACTLAYTGLSRKLAMRVGGEYRFAYIRDRHWAALASELGLTALPVRRDGLELADRFERALPAVRAELGVRYGDQPIFTKVAGIVTAQIASLRASLPATARTRKDRHTDA